jgi:hypothetical protein
MDLFLEDPGQPLVIRCKEPLAFDASHPLPPGIKDQDAPAAVVPADRRAGQVYGAVPLSAIKAEERAGLGAFGKDLPVSEECDFIRVDCNGSNLTGILVSYREAMVPKVLLYGMDKAEMAATFPALAALKWHVTLS